MGSFYSKKLLFFFLIFINNIVSFSQSAASYFQKIDEENGLSDNNIQSIFKDQNGFMWIGTASGLNLLDGSTITVFKNISGDTHSLCNNSVNTITSDSSGIVWIGTQGGLQYFDPVFRTFNLLPLHKNSSSSNVPVTSLAVDKRNNLFITTPFGLFFYDKKNKKTDYIEIPGNKYEEKRNNDITHISFTGDGLLWLTTYNGLWSYDENSHQFIHRINKNNDPHFSKLFTTFIVDHTGKLWIGTWTMGLKEYDPKTKKIISFALPAGRIVKSIAETKQPDGTYIILINGNSLCYLPTQNKFLTLNTAIKPGNNQPAAVLYSRDKKRIWIGTQEGLYIYDPSKDVIRSHRFASPITDQGVAIFEWKNKILVGAEGKNFLKAYDETLKETDDFDNQFTQKKISCLAIKSFGPDMIRCGTTSGVADINLITHTVHFHQLPDTEKNSSQINFITDLLKEEGHSWLIFPWRNGIWITDSSFQKTKKVFNNFLTDYNIPKPLVISGACGDKNKNIWFSDYDEGIIFYDHQTKKFSKPFLKYLGERASISQLFYKEGYCYSFSGNSLLIWNVDSTQLQIIKLPPQSYKPIISIAADSSGHLWIATSEGLLAYNFKSKAFTHFSTANGLPDNNMNGTLYCLKDGNILFACPDYLSVFDPEKMLKSVNEIPQIKLSEVIVDGKPFRFDMSKKEIFDHNVHGFIFKWVVTDYTDPLNNRYFYKLTDIDKEWRFIGKKGEIEFANLSPGNYTLLLKGENSNGIPADKILKLQFEIALPFWRTWWFLAILFCGIGSIFYFLYRYRVNQLLQIEKLRNKISLDLHDDIGSTLSSISILSEIALHEKRESDAKEMLNEIKDNSISLMERMDDIVWSINPKNDSLENLFLRIKIFAAKLFEAKGINYKIDIDENIKQIPVAMEYRRHIYLIMKEAINNLVKYSGCTNASIAVSYRVSILTAIIEDNGSGYDLNQITFGNGLHSMKKRAEAVKGEINMTSGINEGTSIILKVKIK